MITTLKKSKFCLQLELTLNPTGISDDVRQTSNLALIYPHPHSRLQNSAPAYHIFDQIRYIYHQAHDTAWQLRNFSKRLQKLPINHHKQRCQINSVPQMTTFYLGIIHLKIGDFDQIWCIKCRRKLT